MDIQIRNMEEKDYEKVVQIYKQGIDSGKATFQTEAPSVEDWNKSHIKECRFVAVNECDEVVGWVALSPTSSRCVYKGVAEVSIYIGESSRGKQVGTRLLNEAIEESERQGYWTLQSGIFEINEASIQLHKKCGFRLIGVRERVAQDYLGVWRNTVLLERRSPVVGSQVMMSRRADIAVDLFLKGLNCAQAVFSVFSETYGFDKKLALKIACGLGGGARLGEICGAASGAVLVIGLKYGNDSYEDLEAKGLCYEKTTQFLKEFQKQNDSVVCKDLLECNISTSEGMDFAKEKELFTTTCPRLVASAVKILEQLGY